MVGMFVSHGQAGTRVAITGAARNSVFRWTEAEKALSEGWSPEVPGGVSLPPEQFNDNIHGTALYRAHLAKVLLQRAIKTITLPQQEELPMQMQGERKIAAKREKVWAALNEPAVLKASIPGCEALDGTVSGGMTATAAFKVGPISARFSGKVVFSEVDPPNGYVMAGEGAGGIAGFAKGGARVSLEDVEDGTLLRYNVDAQVGGKIAQLGARLIDATAKKMADQFFVRFASEVEQSNSDPSKPTDEVVQAAST